MAERIDLPAMPKGEPEEQLEELYRYLYRMAEALNANLAEIGGADLTDEERQLMLSLTQADGTTRSGGGAAYDWESAETLKSLIIKTATWVKNTLDSWRISLLGEYVAQGKFGKYVRNTSMDVDVTPAGTKQTFKFHEIIEDLKKYEVNAKNYIKTGYLRSEGGLPVYGVAVGKDIVTFAEDGTETYNDSNKVGEFTADGISFFRKNNGSLVKLAELLSSALKFYYAGSLRTQMDTDGIKFYNGNVMLAQLKAGELDFYQDGSLAMKLTSSRLGFYNSGTECMYISGGKIYTAGDMEIGSGKKITIGGWTYSSTGAKWAIDSTHDFVIGSEDPWAAGRYCYRIIPGQYQLTFMHEYPQQSYPSNKLTHYAILEGCNDGWYDGIISGTESSRFNSDVLAAKRVAPADTSSKIGGSRTNGGYFSAAYINTVHYYTLTQESSREVKQEIRKLPGMGEKLDALKPVSYAYNEDPEKRKRFGLIYEDTLPVMPEICVEDDGRKAINYVELVPVLLKEIQDLRKRMAVLEKRVEELEGRE